MSYTGYAEDCDNDNCELEQQVRMNSPRLLKACKKQGIEPHELLKKNITDIREMYKKDNLNRSALLLATQHYEERRQEKLRIVLKERTRMIDEEEEWAYVPYNKNRSDLHMAKGRTIPYVPKNDNAKRTKERRQLGEMIIDQQAEMDALIANGGDPFEGMNDYQRRLAHTRAKEAQLERRMDEEGIEVIGDEEYGYDYVGKEGMEMLKKKKSNDRDAGKRRRKQQRHVYKREIEQFSKMERKIKDGALRARTYGLTKKSEGILLENRVIFAHPHRREKMNVQEKAMKDYLEEQMKMRGEDDKRRRQDKQSLLQYARNESKRILGGGRQQLEIKKGMGVYEDREREFGPAYRDAVKAAQRDPAIYSRLIQKSLFEPKDKPEKFKHNYNSGDSDSDNGEWEDVGYAKRRSPVGSMATTKSSWHLGGENRKTIYDVTGWQRLSDIEAVGKQFRKGPNHSSISSEFAKSLGHTERRQPVKVTYNVDEDSGDDVWEEDLYNGPKSPAKTRNTSKSNWSQLRTPQRRDQTIYDVTGWERISDPTTAEKAKLKSGHSSITSEFVKNARPEPARYAAKNYNGEETDSDWEDDLNRGSTAVGARSGNKYGLHEKANEKTIYDITGWKKLNDGEVPRGSYKGGKSSISSNFARNADDDGEFLMRPSFKGGRIGRNQHDVDEEEIDGIHLDRAVKAARMEKDHNLQSLAEYERERDIKRGMTLGSFDAKKEKRYVERLLDSEKAAKKHTLQKMFSGDYEVY